MYARIPGQSAGRITSVVIKEQLIVIGDGTATLRELCRKSKRCRYHWDIIQERFQDAFDTVPEVDQEVVLVEIGTHSRGATFRNGNYLISDRLAELMHTVSARLPGFYIGRYDLKAASFEELLNGNFSVLELNGANSEPAHIYDPDNKLVRAYRDLFSHWKLMARISKLNMQHGYRCVSVRSLVAAILHHGRRKNRTCK